MASVTEIQSAVRLQITAYGAAAQSSPAGGKAQGSTRTTSTAAATVSSTPVAAPATINTDSSISNLSLAQAQATISAGANLVAQYVMGVSGHLDTIRIVDPSTHQVIAESPPDSIAQIQAEIATFQHIGQSQAPKTA